MNLKNAIKDKHSFLPTKYNCYKSNLPKQKRGPVAQLVRAVHS